MVRKWGQAWRIVRAFGQSRIQATRSNRKSQAGIEATRDQDEDKAAQLEQGLALLAASYNVLPMDAPAFRGWGRLTHRTADALREDAMIAATARLYGLTVVTRNVADFKALGVAVPDPFKAGARGR